MNDEEIFLATKDADLREHYTWECWAYVSPEGGLYVCPEADREDYVWNERFYGAEIQAAKARGARVIRVRIEEIEG